MANILLFLTGIFYAISAWAILRHILRKDGLLGFFVNVFKRDDAGNDLVLFALALCFALASLIHFVVVFNLTTAREEWFITMRQGLTLATSFVVAIYFVNGRIAKFITRIVKHSRIAKPVTRIVKHGK